MKISELGLKIRHMRELSGQSRDDLAKTCHISPRTLAKIERGEIDDVRMSTVNRIAEALGVPLSTLVADSEEDEYPEDERIVRRNYRDRDPYHDISTYVELVLAFPVLDYSLLIDSCQRICGDIVGRESYAEKQFQFVFDHSPASPAKQYVTRILDIIHKTTKELGKNMTMNELRMRFDKIVEAEMDIDPDFEKEYEAYIMNMERLKSAVMTTRSFCAEMQRLRP